MRKYRIAGVTMGTARLNYSFRLLIILIMEYIMTTTCIDGCIIGNNGINCSINQANDCYGSELLINTFEHVFQRINNELMREYRMNLKESEKDLTYVKNVTVDDRIDNYITSSSNKIIKGIDIKHGVSTILRNYNEGKDTRAFHSEPLDDSVVVSGLVNLLLTPSGLI